MVVIKFEDVVNEGNFGGGGVHATEGRPVICHHSCPNHIATSVHCTCLWSGNDDDDDDDDDDGLENKNMVF